MLNKNYENCFSYFADGKPVPDVLTEEEAIKFLRLDDSSTKKPCLTLQYYRKKGFLRATKVGKKMRYLKSELLQFLNTQTKKTNAEIL